MPKGLRRYYGHEYLHYLTCSCYHRQPWLATAERRDLFLQILEEVRQRYGFVVVGYVVMPNHIHLLISEPQQGTQSTVMQVLKQRYARRVLAKKRGRRRVSCGRMNRGTSGSTASTTSMCGASASVWRSCATCIAIR